MDRRDFVVKGVAVAGMVSLAGLAGCGPKASSDTESAVLPAPESGQPVAQQNGNGKVGKNRVLTGPATEFHAAIASNNTPDQLLNAVMNAIGGIAAFVNKGDFVVIKPNLAWGRTPEQAANTSPEMLKAVIEMVQAAGPREVLVVDHTCDNSQVSFDMSGGKAVCDAAGVKLLSLDNKGMFQQQNIALGSAVKQEMLSLDILECDAYINLPCLKHHSATNVSLALKNQMGTIFEPGSYHRDIPGGMGLHQCIADLATALRPTLTIIDATRALTSNGPKGPGNVQQTNTLIASHDMVLADALAVSMLGFTLNDVPHIRFAAEAGVGSMDVDNVQVARV